MKRESETHAGLQHAEQRTRTVVLIALTMMVVEIVCGQYAHSMALLADGIHQGTHVLVLGISWGAYILARRLQQRENSRYDADRLLALSGFTSGVLLLVFALMIVIEAVERLLEPNVEIRYMEALVIALVGLAVNSVCAWLLHGKKSEQDINGHSAYLHVLSDALTGIGAVIGLCCGWIWGLTSIDAIVALAGAAVILRWAVGVILQAGRQLIS